MHQECLVKDFQRRIIVWFQDNGRRFCWRTRKYNLWQWLILELLLKRTKAETVEKLFPSFIAKYHCPEIILQTRGTALLKDLRFLGLHRQRSIALKQVAEKIVSCHNGKIPENYNSLISLPYIGRYTANAVLCFSLNQRRPIVDVNIARLLTRFHGLELPKDSREEWIWNLAEIMLPEDNWKEYNYALLDFGAAFCKSKLPRCLLCNLKDICRDMN